MEQVAEYSTRSKNVTFPGTSSKENSKQCTLIDAADIIVCSKRTKNNKKKARKVKVKKCKHVSLTESGYMKIKTADDNPTPEMVFIMVMNCIKFSKNRNGVSFEDISKYVEEKYQVDINFYKSYIKTYLQLNVEGDKLARMFETDKEEKFKIKKSLNVKKVMRNLVLSSGKEENADAYSMHKNKNVKDKVSGNHFTSKMNFTEEMIEGITINKIFTSTPKPIARLNNVTAIINENGSSVLSDSRLKSMKNMTVNENGSSVLSDSRLKSMKNTTVNEKSKSQDLECKEKHAAEVKNLKKKAPNPLTSKMVMDSIKSIRKRNGVTFEDIQKHIEENYQVNMKMLKSHVNKFLKKSVDDGTLERVSKTDAGSKYKIKKLEKIKRESQIPHRKKTNAKSATKKTALKKSVKK